MTLEEYFHDWLKVIDRLELNKVLAYIKTINPNTFTPNLKDVFKAFSLCPYDKLKIIIIGKDPYPNKGIATGIAFANKDGTKEKDYSPSLKVIRDSVINFEIPHNLCSFDPTLESWEKQGVLMLNAALTVRINEPESHLRIWKNFIICFLKQLSSINSGLIYILMGSRAQALEPFVRRNNYVFKVNHPSYYVRTNRKMPSDLWVQVNNLSYKLFGEKIEWYKEHFNNLENEEI